MVKEKAKENLFLSQTTNMYDPPSSSFPSSLSSLPLSLSLSHPLSLHLSPCHFLFLSLFLSLFRFLFSLFLSLSHAHTLSLNITTSFSLSLQKCDTVLKVVAMYEEASRVEQKDPEIFSVLGVLYNLSREYEMAEAAFARAVEVSPRQKRPSF